MELGNPRVEFKLSCMNDDACDAIIEGIYHVLEHTGSIMKSAEARELMANAGCTVEGELVKMPRSLVEHAIETAPKDDEFVLYTRDGDPAISFTPYSSSFGSVITTVAIVDPETGEKRTATRQDAANTTVVMDACENIDYIAVPAGIFDGVKQLSDVYEVQALVKNTNKPIMYWASNLENLKIEMEILEAAAGGAQQFQEKPFAIDLVCPLDPLVHTKEGLDQIIYMAKKKAPVVYIAGSGMGSTAPISIPGSLVVSMADTIAGLVVSQVVNPGAPFVVSKFSDVINMQTVSSYHSAPEFWTANIATCDVFRRLRLPFCLNGGDSDSGVFDIVAAHDASSQIHNAILAGSAMNFSTGCLANGMLTDYAAIMFNNEIIGYYRKQFTPFAVDEFELQLEEIDDVGPGNNFLVEDLTLERYQDIWSSSILRPRSFDDQKAGKHADDPATELRKAAVAILKEGPKHPLDAEKAARVDAIIAGAEAKYEE